MNAPTDTPKRAVAYARISTLLHGQSLDNQLLPIRAHVEVAGLKLTECYTDAGISGARDRRPGLDRLLADARKTPRKFDVLLINDFSRIARNTVHLIRVLDELSSLGITVVSLREQCDLSTPAGRLLVTVIAALAQMERELVSERVRQNIQTRRMLAQQQGLAIQIGRPSVMTDEMIQEVVRLHEQGMSTREVERALGRRVSRSTISRILRTKQPSAPTVTTAQTPVPEGLVEVA